MKPRIDNLIIEITRRCNLKCKHCLRGNAQKQNLDTRHVVTLFDKIESMNMLTFTGGEPSLVPHLIEDVISIAQTNAINIDGFYIATNAALPPDKFKPFILACLKCYLYCSDNEISCVNWSNDDYHEMNKQSVKLLSALKFASAKYSKYGPGLPLREGRAEDFGNRAVTEDSIEADEEYQSICGELYLNVKGQIISGCDWSYKNQSKYRICDVNDFSFERVKAYADKRAKEKVY